MGNNFCRQCFSYSHLDWNCISEAIFSHNNVLMRIFKPLIDSRLWQTFHPHLLFCGATTVDCKGVKHITAEANALGLLHAEMALIHHASACNASVSNTILVVQNTGTSVEVLKYATCSLATCIMKTRTEFRASGKQRCCCAVYSQNGDFKCQKISTFTIRNTALFI